MRVSLDFYRSIKMKETSTIELLAPAGNLDIFYSVIDAGADAVYLGGVLFGARAYATNFSTEEIILIQRNVLPRMIFHRRKHPVSEESSLRDDSQA